VEAAIVIGMLVTLLAGVCEYGRIIMLKQLMDNAARGGARYAVVSTSTASGVTTAQIQSYVTNLLANQSYNGLNVQVYQADPNTGANVEAWNAAPFGFDIAVQVDLNFVPAVTLVFPAPVHLTAKSIMRSEAN
jgi:Flp pilus assembly protein TadG